MGEKNLIYRYHFIFPCLFLSKKNFSFPPHTKTDQINPFLLFFKFYVFVIHFVIQILSKVVLHFVLQFLFLVHNEIPFWLIPFGNERVPLAELAFLFGIFSNSSPSFDSANKG